MMESDQYQELKSFEPQERLKQLINYSNMVEVDYNVSPKKYYRSGLEMVRMANVYLAEGNLENAYTIYLRFMTLFLEKIRKHPDFESVSKTERATNRALLREVLPKAEQVKEKLLEKYMQEYEKYIEQLKKSEDKQKKPNHSTTNFTDKTPASFKFTSDDGASFYTSAFSKSSLRTVIVPSKVMILFQNMAEGNTNKNIETCGILAGKLANNILTITHMVIPKQKGNSDSCLTMNEEEIFEYQDQYNLVTIGWIHTHPTQSAFLSSVDLHTHLPYQLLMPEAVAIVVAPKHNESGVFMLTPEYGITLISKCRETGFHPHPKDPPLFMIADHVKIDYNAPLEVKDLRLNM